MILSFRQPHRWAIVTTVATSIAALTATSPALADHLPRIAVEPGQGDVKGPEVWRCTTRSAHYSTRDMGIWAKQRVVRGKMDIRSADPDEDWHSAAEVRFMSLAEADKSEEDLNQALVNGLRAGVSKKEPDRIYLLTLINGEYQQVGWYPKGTVVPFKVTFDDGEGTMRIESGKFGVTVKPTILSRGAMRMHCAGADVSFTDVETPDN